jgi:UDP-glucuronate 4-epimerase
MYGDGRTSRDYTYVDDIVAGILAAHRWAVLQPQGSCRIFNLGGSHPVTLVDMIDAIARTVGRAARIDRQPPQPGDVERTFADLKRSRTELGYEPRIAFADGLRLQWEWLRAQAAG